YAFSAVRASAGSPRASAPRARSMKDSSEASGLSGGALADAFVGVAVAADSFAGRGSESIAAGVGAEGSAGAGAADGDPRSARRIAGDDADERVGAATATGTAAFEAGGVFG